MKLNELRKSKVLTQKELAERAGISQCYVCALEQGKKRSPSMAVIKRLAIGLGVSAADVLEALENIQKETDCSP